MALVSEIVTAFDAATEIVGDDPRAASFERMRISVFGIPGLLRRLAGLHVPVVVHRRRRLPRRRVRNSGHRPRHRPMKLPPQHTPRVPGAPEQPGTSCMMGYSRANSAVRSAAS